MKHFCYLIFCCFFLSSCCEMIEEIYLTKKGNGKAKITIDAKESAPLIAFFMTQAGQSIMPDMPPIPSVTELEQKSKILVETLNKADNGISNANFSWDFKSAKFIFQADFTSISAWNKALQNLEFEGMQLQNFVHYTFSSDNQVFTRRVTPEAAQQFKNRQKNPNATEAQFLSAFQNARYQFALEYEKPIRGEASNNLYLKADQKISMQIRFGELFEAPDKINLSVKL